MQKRKRGRPKKVVVQQIKTKLPSRIKNAPTIRKQLEIFKDTQLVDALRHRGYDVECKKIVMI